MDADSKKYKEISCRDFRADCDFTARAESEEEVMKKCREHACSAHGKCSTTPESEKRMKSRMKDVWG